MTHSTRACFAILSLACAGLAPARAGAQVRPKAASLAQEKEMLVLANDVSKRCAAAMERWIANKEITEEKLFGFLYYPIRDTDPAKFSSDWDRFSDRDILTIEENALARSSAIAFAVMIDRNGYIPTHNQRYSQPLTGDRGVDLVNNRTKRIYLDETGLAAARSQAPFLFQRYQRDTGETMVDLSVPLYVRGVHWGAVRIGYRPADGS